MREFCEERHFIPKSHIVFSKRCKANGYDDDSVRIGKQTFRVWLDIAIIDDGDGGSEPAGNVGDFGGNDGPTSGTKKDNSKKKKGTGPDAKPALDGYRYCVSCDAGPWEVGNSDTGRGIVDYHIGRGCDVVECSERGVVKE